LIREILESISNLELKISVQKLKKLETLFFELSEFIHINSNKFFPSENEYYSKIFATMGTLVKFLKNGEFNKSIELWNNTKSVSNLWGTPVHYSLFQKKIYE